MNCASFAKVNFGTTTSSKGDSNSKREKFFARRPLLFPGLCATAIKMYCVQWLIPVLLIPKPVNPALLQTHVMFMVLYLIGFFLERKPCTVCSLVFLATVFLICYSGIGNCLFWSNNCDTVRCDNG